MAPVKKTYILTIIKQQYHTTLFKIYKIYTFTPLFNNYVDTTACTRKTGSFLKVIAVRHCLLGTHGGAVGWGNALRVGRSRVRFRMVSLEFFIDIILPAALWPSHRNEYHKYFQREQGGRCVGLITFSLSFADCHEILEPQPPGPLKSSTGIAAPIYILLTSYMRDGYINITHISLHWHLPENGNLSFNIKRVQIYSNI